MHNSPNNPKAYEDYWRPAKSRKNQDQRDAAPPTGLPTDPTGASKANSGENRKDHDDWQIEHSFATLISHDGTAPFASHLPMLFRPDAGPHGTLVTHMARANPQWQHFASGSEVLVIFHGPHSYISPSWYQTELAVPTWNYASVHAYGVPTVINEHEPVVSLLREMVSAYEAPFEKPWPGNLPDDYRDKHMLGIVAFEIPVNRIEGKFKLGQNRSAADTQGVFEALSRSADADARAVARMMLTECNVHENA